MILNRWKATVWKFNGWSIEEFHRQIRHNLPSYSCKSIGGIASPAAERWSFYDLDRVAVGHRLRFPGCAGKDHVAGQKRDRRCWPTAQFRGVR